MCNGLSAVIATKLQNGEWFAPTSIKSIMDVTTFSRFAQLCICVVLDSLRTDYGDLRLSPASKIAAWIVLDNPAREVTIHRVNDTLNVQFSRA